MQVSKEWRALVVAVLALVAGTATAQSSAVKAQFSGLVYNRTTQTYNSVLTLTNNGPALNAPLAVTISTGSAAVTVSGANASGAIAVAPLPNGILASNGTAQWTVAFVDPTRVSFIPTVTQVTGAPVPGEPVAVINTPSAVTAFSTVVLDGTASADASALIESYAWTQTAGPTVSVSNATSAQASFVAPQVTSQTPFSFSLAVTDTTGVRSTASMTVTVYPATAAQLAVTIVSARMLQAVPANPHTNFVTADGPPLAGSSSTIEVNMTGAVRSPAFTLVDANGSVLSTPSLTMSGTSSVQPLTFFGPITVPTVPFRVAASGTTADGQTYAVQSATLFAPMNVSIGFSPSFLFLAAGATGNSQLTIYNGGHTASFTVQFNDPNGLLSSSQAVSVPIAALTSATVPISVTYPSGTAGIIGPTVTATASVSGDATRVGTATLTLWQGVAQ